MSIILICCEAYQPLYFLLDIVPLYRLYQLYRREKCTKGSIPRFRSKFSLNLAKIVSGLHSYTFYEHVDVLSYIQLIINYRVKLMWTPVNIQNNYTVHLAQRLENLCEILESVQKDIELAMPAVQLTVTVECEMAYLWRK